MKLDQIHFKYTGDKVVVYRLDIEADYSVLVVGDPDMVTYEWVLLRSGDVVKHSDDGYGWWVPALRDALSWFCDGPRDAA